MFGKRKGTSMFVAVIQSPMRATVGSGNHILRTIRHTRHQDCVALMLVKSRMQARPIQSANAEEQVLAEPAGCCRGRSTQSSSSGNVAQARTLANPGPATDLPDGVSPAAVVLPPAFLLRGTHGCDRHPVFPAPSVNGEAKRRAELEQIMSRERACMTQRMYDPKIEPHTQCRPGLDPATVMLVWSAGTAFGLASWH